MMQFVNFFIVEIITIDSIVMIVTWSLISLVFSMSLVTPNHGITSEK